ncbi:MAG: radical SAM family heme chaperone HemW [Ignavibacteria bacterium]|nr:radical SAM family heme chaperone HemW [Ignavibacteria bacterium]
MSLGIYIHIPFCHRRCNYCDFYLTTNMKLIDNFVDSLINEIILFSDGKRLNVDSIYLGGGTPSVLDKSHMDRIFAYLRNNFSISEDCEISAECNPEDLTGSENKLTDFKDTGINRISLGVQSFIDDELIFLSRQHNSKQAYESVLLTGELFRNYSVDLIYDLPGQDISSIETNISKISELKIPHVSAYTLITEKGTLLHKRLGDSGRHHDDKSNERLYALLSDKLKHLGYSHYEISNYAKKDFESRHNLKYWTFKEYVGFGPSSHSFLEGKRWNNYHNIRKYRDALESGILPRENIEELSPQQLEEDFFICTLRSIGVDKKQYKKLFGSDFDESYIRLIDRLLELNLGKNDSHYFSLTEKGFSLADEITFEFIREKRNQYEF